MKRVFETTECDEVRNSIPYFLVQRYEKHEYQIIRLKDNDVRSVPDLT